MTLYPSTPPDSHVPTLGQVGAALGLLAGAAAWVCWWRWRYQDDPRDDSVSP